MLTPPIQRNDHWLGSDRPLVTVLEYGDYECPFCGRAHPVVVDMLRRIGQQMLYAFRHFPLSRVHPHALEAALAAEAAGAQGQFWQMHDTLFTHQDALDGEDLVGYAQDLGLDVPRFIADIRGGRHLAKVRSDFRSGVRSGVNGTPTFFIDGRRFDGNWADGSLTATVLSLVESRVKKSAAGRIETQPY